MYIIFVEHLFALQTVGPRFGCLHPCTSLMLYKSISFPCLHFGLDVLSPTKSEEVMLERAQLAILKIILGLPARAPSITIHYLLGTLPIHLIVYQKHLCFLHSLLSLPNNAAPKSIFLLRYDSSPFNGFCFLIKKILVELQLPSVSQLMSDLPIKEAWKAYIKGLFHIMIKDQLLSDASHMPSLADVVMAPSKCQLPL